MTGATFSHSTPPFPVTRLRLGRLVLLLLVGGTALLGGTLWLLQSKVHPLTMSAVESTAWPAWLKQSQAYPSPEVNAQVPVATATDPFAPQIAALRAEPLAQQH